MRPPQRFTFHTARALVVALLAALGASGTTSCQSAYYSAMESFGVHKREILVDRVQEAREEQAGAKEQFVSTFDQFKALTNYDGGELEKRYKALDSEYEDCEDVAQSVRKRIASVEDVADALFREWASEIDQIQNPDIKRNSSSQLASTKQRYGEMLAAMKKAAAGMDPVLAAFKDHVLALKHNLNAQAISSLQGTFTSIQDDVSALVERMQASIREADSFLQSMGKG